MSLDQRYKNLTMVGGFLKVMNSRPAVARPGEVGSSRNVPIHIVVKQGEEKASRRGRQEETLRSSGGEVFR